MVIGVVVVAIAIADYVVVVGRVLVDAVESVEDIVSWLGEGVERVVGRVVARVVGKVTL